MHGVERGTGLTVLFILLPAVTATSLLIHRRGQPYSKNTRGFLQPSNVLGFLKPVYPHWGRGLELTTFRSGWSRGRPVRTGPTPLPMMVVKMWMKSTWGRPFTVELLLYPHPQSYLRTLSTNKVHLYFTFPNFTQ